MDYDLARVGERSKGRLHEIEKGAIRRFAEALGETDPVYFDEEVARERGYHGLLAPPTFSVTLGRNPIPGLVMPKGGVLHGEQEFSYGVPFCSGDRITVEAWLEDVKVRSGRRGSMTILTVASEGVTASGDMAFQARSVFIVSEGVT